MGMQKVIVPSLGESVTEAVISKWHKKLGDAVNIDEPLVELETDKISIEVPATCSGILKSVKFNDDDAVKIGDVLCEIEEGAVNNDSKNLDNKNDKKASNNESSESQIFSPAAAKIAKENSIEEINNPSGKDGRVTKSDVLEELSRSNDKNKSGVEERIKMSKIRQTIAKRLKESQNTAAILTTFNEIDMSNVISYRKSLQEKFQKKYDVKLGFMSFFVKAVVIALREIPELNAEIDGDYIVYKDYYNIGVAVGTDKGLFVPVIRDANKLGFDGIESSIIDFATRAKNDTLKMEEMGGGTFSITNGGIYKSLLSTPIINPPQSGILGMHNIVNRPIAVGDNVEIRPMMYVALSYDHRIVDGGGAVTFLRRVKEMIEDPINMMFGV